MKLSQLSAHIAYGCLKLGVLALLKTNIAWSLGFDCQNPVQDGDHIVCLVTAGFTMLIWDGTPHGIAPQMEIIYA